MSKKYILLVASCAITLVGITAEASQFFNFHRRLGSACELKIKTAIVEKGAAFAETGELEIDQAVKTANKRLESKKNSKTLQLSETKTHDVVKVSAVSVLSNDNLEQLSEEISLSQDTPKWPLTVEKTITLKTDSGSFIILAQTANYDRRCNENVVETTRQNLNLVDGHLQIREIELNPVNSRAQVNEATAELSSAVKFLPAMSRVYGGNYQRGLSSLLGQTKTYVYGSRAIPLIEVSAKPQPFVVRFNTLTSAYETLESLEVESRIDGRLVATNFVNFSKSNEYGESIDSAGIRNFAVTEKIWRGRQLSGSIDSLSEVSFDEQDFEDGNTGPLEAKLVANQEMAFDNFGAYWNIESEEKVNEGKTPHFLYTLSAREEAIAKNSIPLTEPANPDSPFLRTTEYVQPNLPAIQFAVKKLKRNFSGTRLEMAQKILKYMPQLIDFDDAMIDENEVVPLNTAEILARGKGVCQHFANVFAALARAAGIPTKIISGYTYEAKTVFGHAWNEVEIQEGVWLPVEPQFDKVFDMSYWQYLPLAVSAELDDPTRKDDLIREDWLLTNFIFSIKKIEKDRD